MKVRMLESVSDEVRSYEPGDLADFADDKARRFIAAGHAVDAEDERHRTAVATEDTRHEAAALADAGERATLPPAKKRG